MQRIAYRSIRNLVKVAGSNPHFEVVCELTCVTGDKVRRTYFVFKYPRYAHISNCCYEHTLSLTFLLRTYFVVKLPVTKISRCKLSVTQSRVSKLFIAHILRLFCYTQMALLNSRYKHAPSMNFPLRWISIQAIFTLTRISKLNFHCFILRGIYEI